VRYSLYLRYLSYQVLCHSQHISQKQAAAVFRLPGGALKYHPFHAQAVAQLGLVLSSGAVVVGTIGGSTCASSLASYRSKRRDLQLIKQEAGKQVEKYLREDILLEYLRYMAGSNEITRKLWEIVQNENITIKEKTNTLSKLMQSYNSRLQILAAGPESYMNIRKSLSEIDLQRTVDSEPLLKAQVQQRKLFPKGLLNFK
jgi:hypothetical protein